VGLGFVIYIVLFILLSRRAPLDTFVGRASNVCAGRGVSCASFGHRYVDGPRRFALQLVALAYLVGVFVIERGLTGSTLGTRLLGIVTVGHDGQPIGPLRALWRSVAGIVDYLPCCVPIVGIVTIFATTGHRRVGDLAAKSLVVERAHLGSPILVPGLDTGVVAGPATFGAPPAPPLTGPPTAGPPAAYPPGPPSPAAAYPPGPPTSPAAPIEAPGPQPYSPPVPPAAGAPAPGTPSTTPPPPADPTQPQWDAERNAYIQWDQVGQRWMQFDQGSQEWRPI
jgi:RDD family